MAKRAKLNDFGNGYCWEIFEIRSMENICFWKSGWLRSSAIKSRQMCMEGIPRQVTGSNSLGYP